MYNSVEDELWKVFTFYSIHGDANQPEVMRPANFVRFCRDSQIISRKLKPTAVELEVARMVLEFNLRIMIIGVDYSHTQFIDKSIQSSIQSNV